MMSLLWVELVPRRCALKVTAWGEFGKHLKSADAMWLEVKLHDGHSWLTLEVMVEMIVFALDWPLEF